MSELEAKLEQYFCEQCELQGWTVYKVKIIGRRGWPDRYIATGRGRAFYCELKREKRGVIAVQQTNRANELRALGFRVHTLDNRADIDLVIQNEKTLC